MSDLALRETLDGGDFIKEGNNLLLAGTIFNQIYLALFGGNIDQTTIEVEGSNEFRFDWCGNDLLFRDTPENQFNSLFERALNETPITTGGIQRLESIAKKDLSYLSAISNVDVSIFGESDTRIRIEISCIEKANLQEREFTLLWDNTRNVEIDTDQRFIRPTFTQGLAPWFYGTSLDGVVGNIDVFADGEMVLEVIQETITARYIVDGFLWFAVPKENNTIKSYTEWEDVSDDGNGNGIGGDSNLYASSVVVSVPEIGIDYDLYITNYHTRAFTVNLR